MSLENIMRYESAAVAAAKVKEHRPDIALQAIGDFYNQLYSEEIRQDPVMGESLETALADAQRGLEITARAGDPSITNTGIRSAIIIYSGKYEKAFAETKVFDLVIYLEASHVIPDVAKQGILEHQNLTYAELAEKANTDEEIREVFNELTIWKKQVLDKKGVDIQGRVFNQSLEARYSRGGS